MIPRPFGIGRHAAIMAFPTRPEPKYMKTDETSHRQDGSLKDHLIFDSLWMDVESRCRGSKPAFVTFDGAGKVPCYAFHSYDSSLTPRTICERR